MNDFGHKYHPEQFSYSRCTPRLCSFNFFGKFTESLERIGSGSEFYLTYKYINALKDLVGSVRKSVVKWQSDVRKEIGEMDHRVERLNDTNAEKWEEFNRNSTEGSFFHSLKWKQIAERDPNYKPDYYLLFKDDAVSGIFPLVESDIRPFRGLVPSTNPHRLHGILDDYSDPESIHYIITELKKINRHPHSISFLCLSTLHQQVIDNITQHPVFPFANDGHQVLDLSECPPEEIWRSFSAKKGQRKFIRRFDENGYRVAEVHSRDDLQLFYQYYMENIEFHWRHSSSILPLHRFVGSLTPDEMRVTLLTNDSIVAGGLLMIPVQTPKDSVSHLFIAQQKPAQHLSSLLLPVVGSDQLGME